MMGKFVSFSVKILFIALFALVYSGFAQVAAPAGGQMVPLSIKLPKPLFQGTPMNVPVKNLEKATGTPRAAFLAPAGCKLISLNKPVISTDDAPVIGEIAMITDGDKEAEDGSYVELGPFVQSVTVDLGAKNEIYAVLMWHYHKQARVYYDVIVQTAEDKDFTTNVKTLFNNDDDNTAGLGVGKDKNYFDNYEGKLVDAKGVKARYVRCTSNGNNVNDLNHWIEVEVWGRPAK